MAWEAADGRDVVSQLANVERGLLQATSGFNELNRYITAGDSTNSDALRLQLFSATRTLLAQIHQVGGLVLRARLQEWELEKQRGSRTSEQISNLFSLLKTWTERVFKCLAETHKILSGTRTEPPHPQFIELMDIIGRLTNDFVIRATIFKKQPPIILKTNVKCEVEITCLAASVLELGSNPPEVKLCLVNELQARAMRKAVEIDGHPAAEAAIGQPSGTLANFSQTMLYQQISDCHVASFRSLTLKNVKRDTKVKKSEAAVTDEKFAIAFHTILRCGQVDVTIVKLSQPFVAIVHGNQFANARATMMWDFSFSSPTRIPWDVPTTVPWETMKPALGRIFGSITGLNGLSESQLNYVGSKLCAESTDVSWQVFNKMQMQNRSFTFWDWLFAAMDLVQKCLAGPWQDGFIVGFVDKAEVQRVLMDQSNGTFLLRFSDSAVGGITVSWVGEDELGLRQVWNLEPWTVKDFSIRSLPDRISDLAQLQFVYPNTPKMDAFGKYCTVTDTTGLSSDYVPTQIAAVMPSTQELTWGKVDVLSPSSFPQIDFGLGDLGDKASSPHNSAPTIDVHMLPPVPTSDSGGSGFLNYFPLRSQPEPF